MPFESPLSRLTAQYFELVDFKHLAIPSSAILKPASAQKRIYDDMFNEGLLSPIIPQATYRLRVLKEIIIRIENDEKWDAEEDEIIEPLMVAMTDLMSQPSNGYDIDTEEPQLSFVSYTVPTTTVTASDKDDSGLLLHTQMKRKQVTTFESRGLIYGSGSTGFRTWEAALHLGTYLSLSASSDDSASPILTRGKKVIELGAGTGFISLLCKKHLGAERVLMTDGNAKLVHVFNGPCREQNGFSSRGDRDEHGIEARQWVWGESLPGDGNGETVPPEQFDIALGADLTYDKSIIPLLIDAISRLFSSHGVKHFVLSATIRNEDTFNAFLDACQDRRFSMQKSGFESPPFKTQSGFFHATQIPIWTYIISPSS